MPRVTRLIRVDGDGVSTSTTGVKISYTAPAATSAIGARMAKIIGCTWFNNAGTPTVQSQIVTAGGLTLILGSGSSAAPPGDWGGAGVILKPGDTYGLNVTGGTGANTSDATISVEEWSCS